ncbi:MAG: EAL domain-containing protein [Burkholderiales bacterium]|nr:EAL domain-containing protein [Burkholderiales bacterium]
MPEHSFHHSDDAHNAPTGSKQVQESLACERFAATIEQTPILAVQAFNRDGIVQVWNKASEALYGISHEQAIGKPLQDLLQPMGEEGSFTEELARVWDSGLSTKPHDWKIHTVAGKQVWVYSAMVPVVQDGKTQFVYCMDVDITDRKNTEERLQTSETRFRTFFEQSADAIVLLRNGQFAEFNPAALKLFGYGDDAGAMEGLEPRNVSPKYQPDGRLSEEKMVEMAKLALQHGNHRFEWEYLARNNKLFWGEALLTAIHNDGEILLYAVVRDISARKEAEHALRLAAQVFENSRDGILIMDIQKRIVSVNPAFTTITGYTAHDALGKPASMLGTGLQLPGYREHIWEKMLKSGHWQGEIWGRRRDGTAYPAWVSITAVYDEHGRARNFIAIFSDITERKQTEEHIRHMVEHDFLTGLPNRALLLDRLQQAMAAAKRHRAKLAVLFLDLDRFKNVNDSLGHHVGDKLLQAVAERLKKCVRTNDTVSRQGGDEFVIMLADIGDDGQAAHIAANILKSINQPYQLDEHVLHITTCIGIAVYPGDGNDIDNLIKHADTAMYHAKESGRNGYQFFNHDMNVRIVERINLENHLRRALQDGQFYLDFQPELDIASGRATSAEALIRWQHPERGVLLPQKFLAVAEECGLIVPIGDWVLRTACHQGRMWREQGLQIGVAVNLAAVQFRQKNFLENVAEILKETRLPPQALELEITESVLFDNTEASINTMRALRQMGIKLAVDDFGTGYSSLSYLKHFPIDKIKIDQSFISDLDIDPNDAAIIRAILIMAKSMKLSVIAEGVETADQLAFLRSQGCDEYQGNYAARPLRAAELGAFLHAR